ncbi:nucleotide exchange factor GrpE [bacterium]|nr:nucleotide exchange factor GrpE [bacterium]
MKRKPAQDQKKKKSLEKKIAALEEQLKKAVADYCNLEARIKKEAFLSHQQLAWRLIDKLLGVLDNLEIAQKHLRDEGLAMAINQFKEVLASEGVEEISTDGEEFNPETMDCVAMVEGKKNQVVETLQKGYLFKGQVIRPAKVKVGKGKVKD